MKLQFAQENQEHKQTIIPKFGEIYYAELQSRGSEQGGRRPVLIVQNDMGNKYSPTVTIIPLTSQQKAMHMPTHVLLAREEIFGLEKDSVALVEQLQLINKTDLERKIGVVKNNPLLRIKRAMCVQLGLGSQDLSKYALS